MKFGFAPVVLLAALSVISLHAGPVPISPSQLGVQAISGLSTNGAGVCNIPNVGGCGGGFSATVAGTPGVTLWCVDSQLFDTNSTYTANIVSLNTAEPSFDNGTQVRYGSVGTLGNGNWLYDISGVSGVTNPDNALTRYRLAAVLITMYNPQQAPADSSSNDAIQQAIWQLTENDTIPAPRNVSQGTNGQPALGPLNSGLLATAAGMLGGFSFNSWAVASGAYDGVNHTLLGAPHAIQTYLVEVTPEPRFYGVLLVSLLGLIGMIHRRRTIE